MSRKSFSLVASEIAIPNLDQNTNLPIGQAWLYGPHNQAKYIRLSKKQNVPSPQNENFPLYLSILGEYDFPQVAPFTDIPFAQEWLYKKVADATYKAKLKTSFISILTPLNYSQSNKLSFFLNKNKAANESIPWQYFASFKHNGLKKFFKYNMLVLLIASLSSFLTYYMMNHIQSFPKANALKTTSSQLTPIHPIEKKPLVLLTKSAISKTPSKSLKVKAAASKPLHHHKTKHLASQQQSLDDPLALIKLYETLNDPLLKAAQPLKALSKSTESGKELLKNQKITKDFNQFSV